MTAVTTNPAGTSGKPVKLPREEDPRNPNHRLAALLDEGSVELLGPDDLSGMLAALGGVVLLGYTQNVFLRLGDPYTLPSIAAVVVGGTLIAGGVGSYWGTMAGALVLTILTSLLTALTLPESVRQIVYGLTLLALLAVYGRQRGLRQ